ncbi:hypothetical protein [Streptomyces beigongshangae]|uniref:hypothetical protein n=1 Tax=Streptomyces beigongshangae TaxID=2841597 RepID=UPI001C856B3A|nr:hypothetical protein [Streptomyces sp. REN17]
MAVTALLAGSGPMAPGTSHATASCETRPTVQHVDWTPMTFVGDVVCPHHLGSVRLQSTTQSSVNGQIRFSPSWFVCWKRGGQYQGSDIWYYTQGDTVSASRMSKGWGYLPAAELRVSTHPVPGLSQCTWS